MEVFTVRDLQEHPDTVIRAAEDCKLSIVVKHGSPVFIALPCDELLLKEGISFALPARLLDEGLISLTSAARMAGRTISEMTDLLRKYKISVIGTEPAELEQRISDFP